MPTVLSSTPTTTVTPIATTAPVARFAAVATVSTVVTINCRPPSSPTTRSSTRGSASSGASLTHRRALRSEGDARPAPTPRKWRQTREQVPAALGPPSATVHVQRRGERSPLTIQLVRRGPHGERVAAGGLTRAESESKEAEFRWSLERSGRPRLRSPHTSPRPVEPRSGSHRCCTADHTSPPVHSA